MMSFSTKRRETAFWRETDQSSMTTTVGSRPQRSGSIARRPNGRRRNNLGGIVSATEGCAAAADVDGVGDVATDADAADEAVGKAVDNSSFLAFLASSLKKTSTAFSRKESMFLSADCVVISLRQIGLESML
jgi:hypothetical protein